MSFSQQEKRFLSSSSASVILPQNTTIPLAQILQEGAGDVSLQDIRQRDTLFFDEQLTAYVVLRIQQCSEETLKSYLSRLQLKLEVWTTNDTHNPDRSTANPASRDIVCTEEVKHDEDPILLISQDGADESVFLNLIWEVQVKLNKPRARAQAAHLTFSPVAIVLPVDDLQVDSGFLKPFQPQTSNLFEPLRGTRGFEHDLPYLPLSKLESIVPALPRDDNSFHIRSITSASILTHLAFVTRLRMSKATSSRQSSSIASLEIELIPFLDVHGQIESLDAVLRHGRAVPLTGYMLSMECRSRDCVTMLYKLDQATGEGGVFQSSSVFDHDVLTVSIKVKLNMSDICQSVIDMQWVTNVDFAEPSRILPQISGAAVQQLTGQYKRPTHDKIHNASSSIDATLLSSNTGRGHNLLTISFVGTNSAVKVGVPFSWQILIVNDTTRHVKLAIIPLARIQKSVSQTQQYARRHATRSSITSLPISEKLISDKPQNDIAPAVLDENIIYAVQHSGTVPPATDLISLTPELRIGPLGPGQCHEDEIRFVAFKTGAFTLDAIRVVDLVKEIEQGHGSPGAVTDIRELPDVIVEDSASKLDI